MRFSDIPENPHPYQGSCILFHKSGNFIRIAFGTGDNLDQDDLEVRDKNGNNVDDYMYITTYGGIYEGPEGLECRETDGGQMLFSHETYKTGQLSDMIVPTLDFMEWPTELDEYTFLASEVL